MVRLDSLFFSGAMLVTVVLSSIGTAMPLYQGVYGFGYMLQTFWFQDVYGLAPSTSTTINLACDPIRIRLVTGAAFSIIAIVFALAALVVGVLEIVEKSGRESLSLGLAVICTASAAIPWATIIASFTGNFAASANCPSVSMKGMGLMYGAGFGVLIAACAFSCAAIIGKLALRVGCRSPATSGYSKV